MSEHEHNGLPISLSELLSGMRGQPEPSFGELGADTRAQLDEIDKYVTEYGPLLEKYGIHTTIDEAAILLPDAKTLWGWVSLAVRAKDVKHVNAADDSVEVSGPIHAHYGALYEFLELADRPWRVEAMMVTSGYSPLHTGLTQLAGPHGGWVHVSFKCPTEKDYSETCKRLANTGEWLPAQICRSSYGRFIYFSPAPHLIGDGPGQLPMLYLKPRVNLRDQEFTGSVGS